MHGGNDDFFSVIDIEYYHEQKRANNKKPRIRKTFKVMFYKEGDYALNFIRVKKSMIPKITQVYFKDTKEYKELNKYVDNRFQMTVTINSIEGKIEAF